MNILYLTITRFTDIDAKNSYTDLMRKFRDEGHNVYVVAPFERCFKKKTSLQNKKGIYLLGVKTLNIQKTNLIEKGIATILIEYQFLLAINKYFNNIKFDLILYSTPPITFTKVIESLKRKHNSISYLLLKDIFPQNAIDLGLFSTKSLIHTFFRRKEINLYKISDFIGCMSPANVKYLLKHNSFLNPNQVEINPNSIEIKNKYNDIDDNNNLKFSIPSNVLKFIYGGNLGKPQGVDFLIRVLDEVKDRNDCFFIIIGSGTEYNKLKKWFKDSNPKNSFLTKSLPIKEYESIVKKCDIGLIFLDYRFTIPNYPSRLLSYLEYKMPILAATDINTDIGQIAEENGYGYWCESKDVNNFTICIDRFIQNKDSIKEMGENGYNFLLKNYTIETSYNTIIKHFNDCK